MPSAIPYLHFGVEKPENVRRVRRSLEAAHIPFQESSNFGVTYFALPSRRAHARACREVRGLVRDEAEWASASEYAARVTKAVFRRHRAGSYITADGNRVMLQRTELVRIISSAYETGVREGRR